MALKTRCKQAMIVCLLALQAQSVIAGVMVETIRNKRDDLGAEAKYEFPVIAGKGKVPQRINIWLSAMELQKLPGKYNKNPFEKIWPPQGTFTSMNYKVIANTPSFLSFVFHYEGKGFHSTGTQNFDTYSGKPIDLSDLFSDHGLEQFAEMIHKARVKRIDDFLAERMAHPEKSRKAEDVLTGQQKMMYRSCRESLGNSNIWVEKLLLDNAALRVIHSPCDAMGMKTQDDLGQFSNSYNYSDLAGMLNAYGRCVLIEQRTGCTNTQRVMVGGIFQGTIDQYPITMIIGAPYQSNNGYFYDKVGTFIQLNDNLRSAQNYTFQEISDFTGNDIAFFDLWRQSDNSFVGSWTPKDNGAVRVVTLHEL